MSDRQTEFFGSYPPPLTKERVNPALTIINIFEMTPQQQTLVTQDINAHDGNIRVLVHPDYTDPNILGPELRAKLDAYTKAVDRLYASDADSALPLFIFEEEAKIPMLKERLEKLYQSNKPKCVVVIPTQPDAPEPRPPGQDINYVYDVNQPGYPKYEKTRLDHWSQMIDIFRQLKVQNILVGGQYLYVTDRFDSKNDMRLAHLREQLEKQGHQNVRTLCMGKCAGSTAWTLAPYFTVQISALAFPHNRLTLRQRFPPKGRHQK